MFVNKINQISLALSVSIQCQTHNRRCYQEKSQHSIRLNLMRTKIDNNHCSIAIQRIYVISYRKNVHQSDELRLSHTQRHLLEINKQPFRFTYSIYCSTTQHFLMKFRLRTLAKIDFVVWRIFFPKLRFFFKLRLFFQIEISVGYFDFMTR